MREFKQVLCGTDFSESSFKALDYGLRFAKLAEGKLIILHLVHVPAGDLLGEKAYTLNFDEAKNRMTEMLEEVRVNRLERYANTELIVDLGDPAEQIIQLASRRNVDLIVTSTHGRSGLSHLIMGSVAEKIIRHAPCPVFVVRSGVG
jgi:nucleotide-binding universal stress UspA family protein